MCQRVDAFHSTTSKAAPCRTDIHRDYIGMKFFWNLLIIMVACSWCDQEFKNVHSLSQHRNTCAVAQKNTPKLLQRQKEKIAQRNEKVPNKDDLEVQPIGDNMDVDHLQDEACVF
jgi:hypothetical protein